MAQRNPSYTERQRRFMCAEYGRKKAGKRTRTHMTKAQLREYCKKPVVKKGSRARSQNPHLTSGKWRFIGMFEKHEVSAIKRIFRIHGIANKVTKDHAKHDPRWREIYVTRAMFDTAYRAITRLYKGGHVG